MQTCMHCPTEAEAEAPLQSTLHCTKHTVELWLWSAVYRADTDTHCLVVCMHACAMTTLTSTVASTLYISSPAKPNPFEPASLLCTSSVALLFDQSPGQQEEVIRPTDMVTKRLQESGSPKQARPVATDSANGPLMLLHLREQCCGHPAASPAGPLALTLGAPAAAADDDACRRCDEALLGSRYLRPAQELLRDAVSFVVGGGDDDESAGGGSEDEAGQEQALREMRLRAAATSRRGIQAKNDGGAGAVQAKLLGLLSELEVQQEYYFQELRRVASSFEPVLGAAATAGYTSLMSRAMTRHFGNLRRAILRKLAAVTRPAPAPRATLWADEDSEEDEDDDDYDPARQEDMVSRLVRRTKQAAAARAAEQVCKPMRGLPEESVAVLRAWLFNHFLDPYPSDNEKLRLAVSTGLSRRQISNWFINARVRLWKPMIEEMYADEFSEDSSAVSSRDDDAGGSGAAAAPSQ